MPRAEARGGMARGDRGVARRAKSGGFGVVPLGFATDSAFVAEAAISAQQVAPPCGRGASHAARLRAVPVQPFVRFIDKYLSDAQLSPPIP